MPKLKNFPPFIDLICEKCKNQFTVPYKLRKRRFCSGSCSSKSHIRTPEQRQTMSLRMSGSGNPRYHAIVTTETRQKMSKSLQGKFKGCTRSEDFKRKVSEAKKKKFANGENVIWRKGLTNETDPRIAKTSKKLSKILKDKFKNGEMIPWNKGSNKYWDNRLKTAGINVSKALKNKWDTDPEYRKRKSLTAARNWIIGYNFPNKVEQKVQNLLPSTFIGNQFIENLQVDFVDYDKKIIVEVNGDFWHMNPELFESKYYNKVMNMTAQEIWNREQNKIKRLEELGYKVITIWESEINRNDFTKLEIIK